MRVDGESLIVLSTLCWSISTFILTSVILDFYIVIQLTIGMNYTLFLFLPSTPPYLTFYSSCSLAICNVFNLLSLDSTIMHLSIGCSSLSPGFTCSLPCGPTWKIIYEKRESIIGALCLNILKRLWIFAFALTAGMLVVGSLVFFVSNCLGWCLHRWVNFLRVGVMKSWRRMVGKIEGKHLHI